ncbi:hypothetical protein OAF46_03715 [Akkermansiaceae bacterium]|nr:hypothetical protein [Akkermansiaceae bacterium]
MDILSTLPIMKNMTKNLKLPAMSVSTFRIFFAAAALTLIAPCAADLANALRPLYKPDLASAKIALKNLNQHAKAVKSGREEVLDNPLSPPSDPVQRRLQSPPAKSKFLAVK